MARGNPAVENGTAIFHIFDEEGAKAIQLSGLDVPYMTTNPSGEPMLDIYKPNLINFTGWLIKASYAYADKKVAMHPADGISPNQEYAKMFRFIPNSNAERKAYMLLLDKIYQYRIIYPELFNVMTADFGVDWTRDGILRSTLLQGGINLVSGSSGMNNFLNTLDPNSTAGYFEYYLKEKALYDDGTVGRRQLLFKAFLEQFIELIKIQQQRNSDGIAALAQDNSCPTNETINTFTPEEVVTTVLNMSTLDLNKLCPPSRTMLIGKILDKYVVGDAHERAIYKLMWTCPSGTIRAHFLQQLTMLTNASNKFILGKLIEAIDDKTMFMGENFNTMIMNYIIGAYGDYLALAKQYPNYVQNQDNINKINGIRNMSPSNLQKMSPQELDAFRKRIVTYNYTSFTKRLFKQVLPSLCVGCNLIPLSNDLKSIAAYDDKFGEITFTNKNVKGFVYVSNATSPITLDALEPIILNDKGNLLDVYASSDNDGGLLVPAIILYFAEKKADAKSVAEGIGTALDVASLVIPGGQATLALKMLNYADKLSAVTSLVANAASDDYPNFSKWMQLTSTVLGISNIAASPFSSVNDLKRINSFDKAVKNISTSEDILETSKHTKHVEDLCGNIINYNASNTGALLTQVLQGGNKEQMLLLNVLEIEKHAAQASENSTLVAKINTAISKLKTIQAGANGISRSYKIQNVLTAIVDKFNTIASKFTKTADGKYLTNNNVQIAHINANGELVMDKLSNLSDLGSQAKLEANVKDATYVKNTNNTEAVDDLLVFDDGGTIKICTGINCFTAGTAVHTKKGPMPIETLQENDVVLSYNETTKMNSWQKITNVFHKTATKLQRIVAGTDTLFATPEHTFYVPAKGWLQAAALSTGMLLQTQTGTASIIANTPIDSTTTVYNFTVANTHTYYVGNTIGLLTHNDCGEIGDLIQSGKLEAKYADEFRDAFANSPLLKKFIDGELDVRTWAIINKSTPPFPANIRFSYKKLIEAGGNAIEHNGTIKLLDKNGHDFAKIINNKILPNRVTDYYNKATHANAVAIGEKMNGYQVYKQGDVFVVKRVPDASAYTASEKTMLNTHPDAHTLEKHGHDVTDEALIKRANDGIAPDGSYMGNNPLNPKKPSYASKFETPEQLKKALENTKPGSVKFNSTETINGNTKVVKHELTDGNTYGKGVPKNGSSFQQSTKVRAIYRDLGGGNWQLETMFPDF